MARRRAIPRPPKAPAGPPIQCDRCEDLYCKKQEQCAFLEFTAIAAGTVHICPDYQPPYFERMCA